MLRRYRKATGEGARALAAGQVTRLQPQTNNAARLSVFVNGDFAFGVHQEVALRAGLHAGQELSVAAQEEILLSEQLHGAREVALRYLGYAPRTVYEVHVRLRQAGFDDSVAARVSDVLSEQQYLDDKAYAMDYVRARFRNRGYGPIRLRGDLKGRGIADEFIEAALAALSKTVIYVEAARAHAARQWPRLQGTLPSRRKKLTDYLVRRGFSYSTARMVVSELQ